MKTINNDFQPLSPRFNELWHPVSPSESSDVIINPILFSNSRSGHKLSFWWYQSFCILKQKLFHTVDGHLTSCQSEKRFQFVSSFTNPLLVFLNGFIWGMILAASQQNLLFPQSLYSKYCHWTFFIKYYWIFVMKIAPKLCPVLQCPGNF